MYVCLEASSGAISKDSVSRIAPRPRHTQYIHDAVDWIHLLKTADATAYVFQLATGLR